MCCYKFIVNPAGPAEPVDNGDEAHEVERLSVITFDDDGEPVAKKQGGSKIFHFFTNEWFCW